MSQQPLRIAALSLAVWLSACGPFRRGGPPDPLVIFNNQSLEQADVYAVQSSGRLRIGTVLSGQKESLKVPASLVTGSSGVAIVARILASSRTPSTGSLTLFPGDTIEV